MKPAPFSYLRAESVEHALWALDDGETKPIAGGQSLLPMMNLRVAAPERLVDIDGLVELERVVVTAEEVLFGALTRHDRLARDPLVREHAPLLTLAARHIGHVAIRNRGTLGGSLAHADPAAELPTVAVALQARIVCDRADGRRREIPAEDFFEGLYTTGLEPDEMVTWIRVPRPVEHHGVGFAEVAPREGDFAWAGAAVVAGPARLRIVVLGLGATPQMTTIDRDAWSPEGAAVAEWIAGLEPLSEPEFRRDVGLEMVRRAAAAALAEVPA